MTRAFAKSAEIRARILGLADHPRIFVDHPLASKTEEQVLAMAENAVDAIAEALTETPKAAG